MPRKRTKNPATAPVGTSPVPEATIIKAEETRALVAGVTMPLDAYVIERLTRDYEEAAIARFQMKAGATKDQHAPMTLSPKRDANTGRPVFVAATSDEELAATWSKARDEGATFDILLVPKPDEATLTRLSTAREILPGQLPPPPVASEAPAAALPPAPETKTLKLRPGRVVAVGQEVAFECRKGRVVRVLDDGARVEVEFDGVDA